MSCVTKKYFSTIQLLKGLVLFALALQNCCVFDWLLNQYLLKCYIAAKEPFCLRNRYVRQFESVYVSDLCVMFFSTDSIRIMQIILDTVNKTINNSYCNSTLRFFFCKAFRISQKCFHSRPISIIHVIYLIPIIN